MLLALEGRFNEALTALADIRRTFTERGDVVQAAQTALDEAVILDWLGDDQRSLRCDPRVRASWSSHACATGPRRARRASSTRSAPRCSRSSAAAARPASPTRRPRSCGSPSSLSSTRRAFARRVGELDEAARLFETVLSDYASLGAASAIEYQLAAIEAARGDYEAAQARLVRIEPDFRDGQLPPHAVERSAQSASRGRARPRRAAAGVWCSPTRASPTSRCTRTTTSAGSCAGDAAARWRRSGRPTPRSPPTTMRRRSSTRCARRRSATASTAPLSARSCRCSTRRSTSQPSSATARLPRASSSWSRRVRCRACSASAPPDRSERSELEQEFDAVTQRLDALEFQGYRGTPAVRRTARSADEPAEHGGSS